VTDLMFTTIAKNGYGMDLGDFMWEAYDKGFPPTDIFFCHDKP
jgi:hypothetical protein